MCFHLSHLLCTFSRYFYTDILLDFMQDPPESIGRGGWSDFGRLLDVSRREYREFLTELGFGPFLGIPYVQVYHPLVRCWVERFFHHTGTFHLSTCETGVLPVDWSTILGIRFGGKAPPSEPVSGTEALEILSIDDPDAIEGKRSLSLRIRYLGDLLRRERDEPSTSSDIVSGQHISSLAIFLAMTSLLYPHPLSACSGMSTL